MRVPTRRRAVLFVTTVLVCASLVRPYDAGAQWDPDQLGASSVVQNYRCGAQDLPEGDVQGHIPQADQTSGRAQQGYNCGLALVSHVTLDLDGRPPNGNANMAWAGSCAYISGSNGTSIAPQVPPNPPAGASVAVVEVGSDGTARQVGNLRNPGALATAETINAVTTPEGRSILVVGQYGNDAISQPKPMDVYDVTDCAHPLHIPNVDHPEDASRATYYWPANIHNLTISGNGRYVFATIPTQAIDIAGLWDDDPATTITYLGNIDTHLAGLPVGVGPLADLDDPVQNLVTLPVSLQKSHEAWPSPDGRTLYMGAQQAVGELFSIVDLSDWLTRDAGNHPAGPPKLISQRAGRGHSIRSATIGGHPYLVHSEESVFSLAYSCIPETANPFAGPAQPWLTDITDPADPKLVSQMGLEINEPEHCLDQLASQENDSVHYQDVDDPNDTTFVMASMWNAGIRVFDVRDPRHPAEVAYFNPGDVDPSAAVHLDHAWGHVRYVAETGQIWFATADGGFWVVRIEGEVRQLLGLDAKNQHDGQPPLDVSPDDPGYPARINVDLPLVKGYVDISPYYCTLAASVSVGG